MSKNYKTILMMTLFAGLFVLIGTFGPVLYATYVPASEIIEVNRFEPTDTTVDEGSHEICWERQTDQTRLANIRTELILLSENGEVEIERTTRKEIIEKGDKTLRIKADLPEEIKAGEYKYNALITVSLANDRVDRKFVYESDVFTVYEDESELNGTTQAC